MTKISVLDGIWFHLSRHFWPLSRLNAIFLICRVDAIVPRNLEVREDPPVHEGVYGDPVMYCNSRNRAE